MPGQGCHLAYKSQSSVNGCFIAPLSTKFKFLNWKIWIQQNMVYVVTFRVRGQFRSPTFYMYIFWTQIPKSQKTHDGYLTARVKAACKHVSKINPKHIDSKTKNNLLNNLLLVICNVITLGGWYINLDYIKQLSLYYKKIYGK